MAFTLFASGQKLRASRLNDLASYAVPIRAVKAGDTGPRVNNTKSNDPELAITLLANCEYVVRGLFIVTSAANAAGDFAYGLNWTNTADVIAGGLGLHNSLASGSQADLEAVVFLTDSATPTGSVPYGASTSNSGVQPLASVVVGSSDILLTVEWAQQATNASGTTLKVGSWIEAHRID